MKTVAMITAVLLSGNVNANELVFACSGDYVMQQHWQVVEKSKSKGDEYGIVVNLEGKYIRMYGIGAGSILDTNTDEMYFHDGPETMVDGITMTGTINRITGVVEILRKQRVNGITEVAETWHLNCHQTKRQF